MIIMIIIILMITTIIVIAMIIRGVIYFSMRPLRKKLVRGVFPDMSAFTRGCCDVFKASIAYDSMSCDSHDSRGSRW